MILGIRPESFEDAALAPELPSLEVVVEVLEDLGSDAHVFFTVEARSITAEILEADDEERPPTLGGALFTARVGLRTSAEVGERVSLAVDPKRVQFFHPETGLRLVPTPVELTAKL